MRLYAITPKKFAILAKILEANFGCGFAALGIIQVNDRLDTKTCHSQK